MSNDSLSVEANEDETWFVDFGASSHMTSNKHWYENFKETNNGANIYLGDDRAYQIRGYGNIPMIFPNDNIKRIQNVMFVPSIKKNLISVSMIAYHNLKVEFLKTYCVINDLLDHQKLVTSRVRGGGIYKLNVTSMPHQDLTSTTMTTENLWHQIFGHINLYDLLLLQK